MAFIAPIVGALGGGGAAAAAGASSIWGTIGTILSVTTGLADMSYKNKVATQAAATAQTNSDRAIAEGQTAQKDQDEAASIQLAEMTAKNASSGFSLNSPTFRRVDNRNRILARRDAERIRQGSIDTAQNFQVQKAEALSSKQNLLLPAIAGAIDIKSSMISGANLTRKTSARTKNTNTRWQET